MSKAIVGAVELAGAAVLAFTPGLNVLGTPWLMSLMFGLAGAGATTEAGAIAQALGSKSGLGVTTRTPAALRQIIRGERRIGGTIVYQSTTGSTHKQYNMVIVLATHQVDSIVNLYLDGRQVFWSGSSIFTRTRGGVTFGGDADGSNHTGPNGVQYSFGGKVFCEAFYGDQTSAADQVSGVANPTGGYSTALNANDRTWAPDRSGNIPYLKGCTWVYLKIEADAGTFPQFPEIRFTVRGKNDIYDPRTSTRGYTSNWALHVADAITDPVWGLGDSSVNQAQLIAAANVCDELVTCAAGSEARYALHWAYDTGTSPGEAIQHMMSAAGGRLSRVGGEYYIWPAYWRGTPGFTFDANSLLDTIQWTPKRSIADLANRVTGTYIAPNYPYNTAGNLYDSNGYWMGMTANTFPYAYQPTNFPQYAQDTLHGFSEDALLIADTPNSGNWNNTTAYAAGTVIIYGGAPWVANENVPAGDAPGSLDGSGNPYWSPTGRFLPIELNLDTVLSVSQAQRLAKIELMRRRQQGSGTLMMSVAALQMMPVDTMYFNMPQLGWSNKLLEIAGEPGAEIKIRYAQPPRAASGESGDADNTPALWLEVPVNETDPSVYEWDPSEELTPYDMPALGGGTEVFEVAAPSGLAISDTASTALLLGDGTTQPRIFVTWTPPTDPDVLNGGSIQVQWKDAAGVFQSGAWIDAPAVSGGATGTMIDVVSSVANVNVQIRAVRANGAVSAWVPLGSTAISAPSATIGIGVGFTVLPTVPTASPGTSNTDVANTQFVATALAPAGQRLTAAGAISPSAEIVLLQAGSAAAMTLAAPTVDYTELEIMALDAFAYTVTTPSNKINGNKSVATWAAAIGNKIHLVAFGGVWYADDQNGITLT